MLVLISAMRTELKGIESDLQELRRLPYANGSITCGTYQGIPIAWVACGIGRKNAQRAMVEITKDFPSGLLLVLGFAGSLSTKLNIGDLAICQSINCEAPGSRVHASDADLVEKAMQAGSSLPRRVKLVECLTVDRVLATPDLKKAYSDRWHAEIVEMENYWIAEQAFMQNVRFIAVRAISDTAQDRLPDFDRLLEHNEHVPFIKGMRYFSAHPDELRMIPQLYQHIRQARKSLLDFVRNFIPLVKKEKLVE